MTQGRTPPRPIPRHEPPLERPAEVNGNGHDGDEPPSVTMRPLRGLPDRELHEDTAWNLELTAGKVDELITEAREAKRWRLAKDVQLARVEDRQIAQGAAIGNLAEDMGKVLAIATKAQTTAKAAKNALAVRTSHSEEQLVEVLVEEKRDEILARRERRALVIAGAKRVAVLVTPLLTAAIAVAVTLLSKGC